MKYWIMALSLIATHINAQNQPNVEQARQIVKQYAHQLKSTLKKTIQQEGIVNAIETCHLKAPDITHQISQSSGWTVRRTSLKVRNLEDAPDKWEYRVLKSFAARQQAGESIKNMEYSQIVQKDGQSIFRYMKAIPTQKICLQCHGQNIRPEIAQQLDSLYPFDQARGFKQGDIRGAFSLSKPVH